MNRTVFFIALLVTLVAQSGWGQENTHPWPSTGKVGIGTTEPTTTLDVNGSVRARAFILDYSRRELIGSKTGTFTGTWSISGSVTDGNINTRADAFVAGGTIEWSLADDDQWALNGQSIEVMVGGWWWPTDLGTSPSFAIDIWDTAANAGAGGWVQAGTFGGFGVHTFSNPVAGANPPTCTKIRVRVSHHG